MANPLSQEAVYEMAVKWYGGLDNHVPEPQLTALLEPNGLEMQWPDYHVQNIDDFDGWYQRALGIFFDEQHTIKELVVSPSADGTYADVKVFVNWKARVWTFREARSKYLNLDIHQTWVVVPSADGTKPLIKFIRFDDGTPLEGSDTL
jgi:hypothetical protein